MDKCVQYVRVKSRHWRADSSLHVGQLLYHISQLLVISATSQRCPSQSPHHSVCARQ